MIDKVSYSLYNAKINDSYEVDMSDIRINCKLCINYYVTWDNNNPMGCKKFGFKSRIMPSEVVYRSSGALCNGFEPKILK